MATDEPTPARSTGVGKGWIRATVSPSTRDWHKLYGDERPLHRDPRMSRPLPRPDGYPAAKAEATPDEATSPDAGQAPGDARSNEPGGDAA